MKLDAKIPAGPLAEKWDNHKFNIKLVNPANKRKFSVIVVGTGLAGASAASTLAELGYNVTTFCFQDSPRRAHSIAAQGGINAAKNYQNDGDSIYRLFYDTIKGGDYRSREANVYRLSQVSVNIIDQAVAQGVPFAREYGGYLSNRSFGGAQVSRTFYARGQTGQQLLLGAYSALSRQIGLGKVKSYERREVLDIVLIDGHAKGVIVKNLVNGETEKYAADAVVLASGGYGNVYFLSTNAMNSNTSAAWRAHRKGALFANPAYVQIHPTCIPVHGDYQSKLTLMSESLRNDGRVWVPKDIETARKVSSGQLNPSQIAEEDRDYYLERKYPSFGNLVPRDVASRNAKYVTDEGRSVEEGSEAVFLDFSEAIGRLGKDVVEARYGNLFEMYNRITDDDPYSTPMKIFPAVHYTMGGLWVDYNLSTNVPGLYALGEANFSDHGANRLGASALMQGLADGYFVIPFTIGDYLASQPLNDHPSTDHPAFKEAAEQVDEEIKGYIHNNGSHSVDTFHKRLGKIMWDYCGMARNAEGLKKAKGMIQELREEYHKDMKVPGSDSEYNPELQKAWRVADFMELGELMIDDALQREESAGGHFREEHQTEGGEALRKDEDFAFVGAWEYQGRNQQEIMHKEELEFEYVELKTRSYK
ncbi:MAG: fumarate reductase/succinate dehydrogenase flavoprotein subunit [Bacteroidia bacterium]|nr:fumarate reductase/succinate dehydrogenase flavoprotein subunit [Bacteroidia bacterium]